MRKLLILIIVCAVAVSAAIALAEDYSRYSTEELSNMRGTMSNASEQEREAFRNEWQKRVQNMNQEEMQKYTGKPENAGQGKMMQQRGYGGGMGGGKGKGR